MRVEEIEKAFFSFTLENGISPSRKDMVNLLGISGEEILENLGPFAKNLERAWVLNTEERIYLAGLIVESPSELHVIASNVSFLPVWASESKVVIKKQGKE